MKYFYSVAVCLKI